MSATTYTVDRIANLYGTNAYTVRKAIEATKVKGTLVNGETVYTLEAVRVIETKIPGYKR